MATGVAQSVGDGVQPQVGPPGARPPLIPASEHQPPFMTPTSTVRPTLPGASGIANTGGPLLARPPPGSPPSGPAPLFPPQAAMSRPPQAGGPQFPPPGLPNTPPGADMPPPPFPRLLPPGGLPPPSTGSHLIPPSTQPPQNPPHHILPLPSKPPSNFPPSLPPPTGLPLRPPVSSPVPQFPPGSTQRASTSGSQISTINAQVSGPPHTTSPNIGPPAPGPPSIPQMLHGAMPPQFPPNVLTNGPPPLSVGQNILPPGGPQISSPQTPDAQFSPGAPQIPTSGSANPTSGIPSTGPHLFPSPGQPPHSGPPSSSATPIAPQAPSSSNQQVPNLPSPQHTSTQDTPPLLPSPQQAKGDSVKDDAVPSAETGKRGGGEVWYEHKMSDGRAYYSHSQTRTTTWDRPQNVQIVPHPGQQSPSPAVTPIPTGGHPFPLPGMPSATHLVPSRVWSEYKTPDGKPYFYNKITRVSVWEKPKDFDLVMPLPPELGAPSLTSHTQQQPSAAPSQSPASRPPLISTPLMFPPGQPPFNPGFPPGHPGQPMMNSGPPLHMGRFPPPMHMLGTPGHGGGPEGDMMIGEQEVMELGSDAEPPSGETESAQPSTTPSSSTETTTTTAATTAAEGEGEEKEDVASQPVAIPASVPEPTPVKEEPKGPRPTASVPLPGTPWSVVWTSDNRQFFFDVTSRVSLWIMPEELKDNPQLQKILENGPDGNRKLKTGDPSAKRRKLDPEGNAEEEEEEEEEEMEEGGGLFEIPAQPQGTSVPVKPPLTEAMETEKKMAMMRSGKTVEERQEEFKEMLLERGVSAFSTWDKELPKFVFDPRYMLLSSKERKSCFEDFIRSRAEEERKEKRSKLKARRDEFRKLLEDCKLHPKSSFSEFAQRNARDERFKAVEKMREREQLFSEYLQELKKAATTGGTASGKHKERTDAAAAHGSSTKSKADKVKSDFLEMLSEDRSLLEDSHWRKVKGGFERDPRYRAVTGGSSQREEWFKEYIRSLATSSKPADPSREREERIQASLKEREREVKMSRSAHEKEWGRERDQLRKTEAVQKFKAMLADNVRNTGATWNEARRQLRQDTRWDSTGLLEQSDKERLFQEHCDGLMERKRLQFRRLLEETYQISLVMPWKKARKLIRDDPRYKNFTESDHRREAEYDKHLRDKMVTAKNEFRSLLRETKVISYKSHNLVKESEKHYNEIIKVLENDKRYLVLECVAEERERILQDFMRELHLKGPPPPPTASNPSERLRKL